MFQARLGVLSVALILIALGGCSKASKVEGTVTYKGSPVEGAAVVLVDANGAIVANGSTDASGKFTLRTPEFKEDIPAGEYKAIVTKSATETTLGSGEPGIGPDGKMSPDAMKLMKGNMGKKGPMGPAQKKSILPEKFASKDTTTLSVKVPPSGAITLNLDS